MASSSVMAANQMYKQDPPKLNREIQNIYEALDSNISSSKVLGTNGTAPAVKHLGETISSTTAGVSITSSAQWINVAQINLTTGSWSVSGWADQSLNGATMTGGAGIALSAFSGNTTTDHTTGDNASDGAPPTATYDINVSIPNWTVNNTSAGTYYLKVRFVYSAGTPKSSARITAIRK